MPAIIKRLNVIALLISLLLCNISCYPVYSTKAVTAPSSTTTSLSIIPTLKSRENIVIYKLDKDHNHDDDDDDDDDDDNKKLNTSNEEKERKEKERAEKKHKKKEELKKERQLDSSNSVTRKEFGKHEAKSETESDDDDNSHDNNKHGNNNSGDKYSSEDNDNSHHGNDDDKNNSRDKNDNDKNGDNDKDNNNNPSPTNTVVTTVVIVSTETPTIYTGVSSNPGNQKGDTSANHQVSDPNASSDTSGSSISSSTTATSEQSPSVTQIEQILQGESAYHKIVTALSVVGSIAGFSLVVGAFIFARSRVRKNKRKQAFDLEMANNNQQPPAIPPHHSSQPPSLRRFSNISDDGTMVAEFHQNPFVDPIMAAQSLSPPRPTYAGYRQNRTLSMISQTTALPSAPTAKELDVYNMDNPFEDQEQRPPLRSYSITEENNEEVYQFATSNREETAVAPTVVVASIYPRLIAPEEQEEKATHDYPTELPPPPAYTPSVAPPSAPPLYALPTTTRLPEELEDASPSSRRHSISSCSIVSSIQPLSLRRGSGSLAHISTPFT